MRLSMWFPKRMLMARVPMYELPITKQTKKAGKRYSFTAQIVTNCYPKTKEGTDVIQAYVDDYGHGIIGAFDRNGEGRTLKPR